MGLIEAQNVWQRHLSEVRRWRPMTVDQLDAAADPIVQGLRKVRSLQRQSMLFLIIAVALQFPAMVRFVALVPLLPDILLAAAVIVAMTIPRIRTIFAESIRGASALTSR